MSEQTIGQWVIETSTHSMHNPPITLVHSPWQWKATRVDGIYWQRHQRQGFATEKLAQIDAHMVLTLIGEPGFMRQDRLEGEG
jgi:hypothetical protein